LGVNLCTSLPRFPYQVKIRFVDQEPMNFKLEGQRPKFPDTQKPLSRPHQYEATNITASLCLWMTFFELTLALCYKCHCPSAPIVPI
jgi:hypothetical protein